jgi:hypothetical protein
MVEPNPHESSLRNGRCRLQSRLQTGAFARSGSAPRPAPGRAYRTRPVRSQRLPGEQCAVVDLAVIEQDVLVDVARHTRGALPDERCDLSPGVARRHDVCRGSAARDRARRGGALGSSRPHQHARRANYQRGPGPGALAHRRSADESVRRGQCLVQDGQTIGGVAVAHVERWRDMDAVAENQRQ